MRFLTRGKADAAGPPPAGASPAIEKLARWPDLKDQAARRIAEALSELCAAPASIAQSSIEVLSSQAVLALHKGGVGAAFAVEGCEGASAIFFDRSGVEAVATAMLGGADEAQPPGSAASSRIPTPIDLALAAHAAERAAAAAAEAFGKALGLETRPGKSGALGETGILARGEEPGLTSRLRLKVKGAHGSLALTLGRGLVSRLEEHLVKAEAGPIRAPDPDWARCLVQEVGVARVEVVGVLEEIEMTLGEIAQFSVGQVLDLHRPGSGRILLQSGGQSLFWCALDQSEGSHALEVIEAVEAARPPF